MNTIEIPFVNPQPTASYCEAEGVKHFYTCWELSPRVSKALGMGCSGGSLCTFSAITPPVAVCEVHQSDGRDYLVAVQYKY